MWLLLLNFYTATAAHADCSAQFEAMGSPPNRDLASYEATAVRDLKPTKDFAQFRSSVGITVTKRAADGSPLEASVRVLGGKPDDKIYVVGDFNGWGQHLSEADRLQSVPGTPYFEGKVQGLQNGAEYRLVVNGEQRIDPAATTFSSPQLLDRLGKGEDDHLNSVFWDVDGPGGVSVAPPVDLRQKPVVLGETEIAALAKNFPRPGGGTGPLKESDTYRFIAESGLVDELKKMGYNAVEFLPFNSSMDGAEWANRYQVYGLFGPDSRFGTPEDFRRLTNAFNRKGIGVVMDTVIGHYPFKGNQGIRSLAEVGPATWKKADGHALFGDNMSPWDTYRYDYTNPSVRRYLIDSILTNLKNYNISGIRFDNLDGIRFEPGGTEFLRELSGEVRAYRPQTMMVGEMFFGDKKVTESLATPGGLGINFRTDSDFFDWVKDNALKRTEDIDMNKLRDAIRNPYGWGEASRMKYITSHDEASNRRDGATGAYFATLIKNGNDQAWPYVEKKTKAFGSLGMFSSPIYMDSPQLRLLQEGSFTGNPGVQWGLRASASQNNVNTYFSALSHYVTDNPAFSFNNMIPDIENHTDYANKVISLKRVDKATGKTIYELVNLGHQELRDYAFGVDAKGELHVALDSDQTGFGGSGQLEKLVPGGQLTTSGSGLHGKSGSVTVPYVAPGGVVILETP